MKHLIITILSCVCWVSLGVAQQLPYQTQFRQLYGYINPASVSSDYFLYEYNTSINSSYRLQWSANPQTPRTYHLSGEHIINNSARRSGGFNLATGGMLVQDRVGPLSLTGVHARVASLFADDPYFGAFSLGFNFGMTQYRIRHDRIVWEEPEIDPNAPLANIATTRPEIGVGAYYFKRFKRGRLRGDNLYAGLSVPQMWAAQLDVPDKEGKLVPITRIPHFYMTTGWYHFFSQDGFIEVSMWGKYTRGLPPNIHFTGRIQPIRTFWAGGGFNLNGLVHLETGFNLPGFLAEDGNLKIGYAFDYNISAFDLPFGASHELHISYLIDTRR
jgi:type IX secretion system PorP/SprF family membrane protein